MKRYLSELAEGFRVLCSRDFWRAFAHFWSSPEVAKRLDTLAERMRG